MNPVSDNSPWPVLRRFGPMVYLPTVLFAIGEGAVIPLIPVLATQLGADMEHIERVLGAHALAACRRPAARRSPTAAAAAVMTSRLPA